MVGALLGTMLRESVEAVVVALASHVVSGMPAVQALALLSPARSKGVQVKRAEVVAEVAEVAEAEPKVFVRMLRVDKH